MKNSDRSTKRTQLLGDLLRRALWRRWHPLLFPSGLIVLVSLPVSPAARAECRDGCVSSVETTFQGEDALLTNIGYFNTAFGHKALFSNTGCNINTAFGDNALSANTDGLSNTAIGDNALGINSTGSGNTEDGFLALLNNTTGDNNTANGA